MKKSGRKLPQVSVIGLRDEQINQLVNSGDAAITVWSTDGIVYVFDGRKVELLQGDQRAFFSERSLLLTGERTRAPVHAVRTLFAVADNQLVNARVRLMFRNAVDLAILDSQQVAAKKIGLSIEDVVSTVGVLEFNGNGSFRRFRITELDLRGGRTVSAKSD
jgi:hypothetical protein